MDIGDARAVLGVPASASAAEVRAAYWARLRAAHPDHNAGRDAGTAEVVAAYRVLRDAPPEPAVPSVPPEPGPSAVVVDGDTVTADLPVGDLFGLVVQAADALGHLAYVDAHAGVVEVVVDLDGHGACSVVLTLDPERHVATCTVEPLGGGPPPPPGVVAELLAGGLRTISAD